MCWVMPPRSPAATVGRADRVEQAGLAVVDVAHDGHDRRPRLEQARVVLLEEDLLGRLGGSASPRRRSRRRSAARRRPRRPRSRARSPRGDAVSRSMSWLMVAKMPLLMSSRMTSAGLTPSSSASSLTVIVAGSSIAPRSRGSSDLDVPLGERAVAARGLAGPAPAARAASTPGHGLLLRDRVGVAGRSSSPRSSAGSGVLQGPSEGALVDGLRCGSRASAHRYAPRPGRRPVGSMTTPPSGVRTMRTSSRFGRSVRQATQVRVGGRAAPRVRAAATTPPRRPARRSAAFVACVARFGLAAAASGAFGSAGAVAGGGRLGGRGGLLRRSLRLRRCGLGLARLRSAAAGSATASAASGPRRRPRRRRRRRPRPWSCASRASASRRASAAVGRLGGLRGARRLGGCGGGVGGGAWPRPRTRRCGCRCASRSACAASRAFWPSRPMASESIRSGTVTLAMRCSSSMSTRRPGPG